MVILFIVKNNIIYKGANAKIFNIVIRILDWFAYQARCCYEKMNYFP